MIAIADDNVADTHGDTDLAGALDLRAADLDGVAVPDIFLDRRGEPRRRHVEIDRTRAKPPPQPAETDGEDHHQNGDHGGAALYPAPSAKPPAQPADVIAEPVTPRIRSGQQPARAMTRHLVMVLIPTGIIRLRALDVCTRFRSLGRRIPCHCLSVRALLVRLIAANAAPVDT